MREAFSPFPEDSYWDDKNQLELLVQEYKISSGRTDLLKPILDLACSLKNQCRYMPQMNHLEVYVTQIEHLFSQVSDIESMAFQVEILNRLNEIEHDYQLACSLKDTEEPRSPEPHYPELSRVIESLHRKDNPANQILNRSHFEADDSSTIPIEVLLDSFTPWIKQVSKATYKEVHVVSDIQANVDIPKSLVTSLQTILTHLLRNAIHHGIETIPERQRANKPTYGTIQFTVELRENEVILTITDDGQGLVSTAQDDKRSLSRVNVATSQSMNDPTSSAVAQTSIYSIGNVQTGLGIGFHIIQSEIKRLHGSFDIKSMAAVGTSAIVSLPLAG